MAASNRFRFDVRCAKSPRGPLSGTWLAANRASLPHIDTAGAANAAGRRDWPSQEDRLKKSLVTLLVLGLCVTASQNARAQADLGLKAMGVQLGMVDPEGVNATVGFGGFADWGNLTPEIRLSTHLDHWSKSESDAFGDKVSVRDIALTTRAKYMIPVTSAKVYPYVGGGLGMHFLSSSVEVPGFPAMSDGTTKLGIDLGGGFNMPVNAKTDFQAEMWYGIVDGFNQTSVKAGLAFKLGS
jgi:hypothetical protein